MIINEVIVKSELGELVMSRQSSGNNFVLTDGTDSLHVTIAELQECIEACHLLIEHSDQDFAADKSKEKYLKWGWTDPITGAEA